jgi:hypothetical protein
MADGKTDPKPDTINRSLFSDNYEDLIAVSSTAQ